MAQTFHGAVREDDNKIDPSLMIFSRDTMRAVLDKVPNTQLFTVDRGKVQQESRRSYGTAESSDLSVKLCVQL